MLILGTQVLTSVQGKIKVVVSKCFPSNHATPFDLMAATYVILFLVSLPLYNTCLFSKAFLHADFLCLCSREEQTWFCVATTFLALTLAHSCLYLVMLALKLCIRMLPTAGNIHDSPSSRLWSLKVQHFSIHVEKKNCTQNRKQQLSCWWFIGTLWPHLHRQQQEQRISAPKSLPQPVTTFALFSVKKAWILTLVRRFLETLVHPLLGLLTLNKVTGSCSPSHL